jgi:hypothetical protein
MQQQLMVLLAKVIFATMISSRASNTMETIVENLVCVSVVSPQQKEVSDHNNYKTDGEMWLLR